MKLNIILLSLSLPLIILSQSTTTKTTTTSTNTNDQIKVIRETIYIPSPSTTSSSIRSIPSSFKSNEPAHIITTISYISYILSHPLKFLPYLIKLIFNFILIPIFYYTYLLLSIILLNPLLYLIQCILIPFIKIFNLIQYTSPIWLTLISSISLGILLGYLISLLSAKETKMIIINTFKLGEEVINKVKSIKEWWIGGFRSNNNSSGVLLGKGKVLGGFNGMNRLERINQKGKGRMMEEDYNAKYSLGRINNSSSSNNSWNEDEEEEEDGNETEDTIKGNGHTSSMSYNSSRRGRNRERISRDIGEIRLRREGMFDE